MVQPAMENEQRHGYSRQCVHGRHNSPYPLAASKEPDSHEGEEHDFNKPPKKRKDNPEEHASTHSFP